MTRQSIIRLGVVAGVLWVAATVTGAAQQPTGGNRRPPAQVPITQFPTDSQGRIVFRREVYNFPRDGRRDPFASLIATGEIRPMFADLEIAVIIESADPRNSVATLKDVSTGELYRARVGSVLGRIRIRYIRADEVGVAIDEFGFTRQEVLTLKPPRRGR